jgi:hypothetical protein
LPDAKNITVKLKARYEVPFPIVGGENVMPKSGNGNPANRSKEKEEEAAT